MSYNKEDWKRILYLPHAALSTSASESVTAHGNVIRAWVDGEAIETLKNGKWHLMALDTPSFGSNFAYRILPQVEVTMSLPKNQAISLIQILEDANCSASSSREARNKLIKAIERGLKKVE